MTKVNLNGKSRSNANYICIPCRVSKKARYGATCGLCGGEMDSIGKKRKVPKKNDKDAWDKLIWDVTNHPYYKNKHLEKSPEPKKLASKSPVPQPFKKQDQIKKYKLKKKNPAPDIDA